jgi:hypothetical protein
MIWHIVDLLNTQKIPKACPSNAQQWADEIKRLSLLHNIS